MFKRTMLAAAALGVSSSLFAMGLVTPLDADYKAPAFSDIHQGDGAMSRGDYINYVNRSWNETGGKTIDKSHPRYSDYQKSHRFEMMDKNHDGSISQAEYMGFHEDAWSSTKKQVMTRGEFEGWYQDSNNPLNPSYARK